MTWEVGQAVVVESTMGGRLGQLAKVARVTPSGRAVVGGYQYTLDGRCVGGYSRIRPATPEDIEAAELRTRLHRVETGIVGLFRLPLTPEDIGDLEGVLARIRGRR